MMPQDLRGDDEVGAPPLAPRYTDTSEGTPEQPGTHLGHAAAQRCAAFTHDHGAGQRTLSTGHADG